MITDQRQQQPIPQPARETEQRPARRAGSRRATPVPRSGGNRRWEVLTSAAGVAVTTTGGLVAEARVIDQGQRVVLEFWTSSPGLPHELRTELVGRAFAHPALRLRRPVLICAPTGDSEVLTAVRRHVTLTRSHVAGATCLIEGAVSG